MKCETILIDNSKAVLQDLQNKIKVALNDVGMQAEGYAKQNLTQFPRVDMGRLRNSVAYTVKTNENAVYIGTNVFYASYVEWGTGKFASNGKGRQGWWVYVADSKTQSKHNNKTYTFAQAKRICRFLRAKGLDAHMTQGMKPAHFLRDAVDKHKKDYLAIIRAKLNSY